MIVREHEGVVNAGKRLILRVLEETRRSHGDRVTDHGQERRQIARHLRRHLRPDEAVLDLGGVAAVEGKAAELIALEKVVEHVGPQHHRGRHADAHIAKPLRHPRVVEQQVDEREPACFAAQRSAADATERRGRIERRSGEIDDHAALCLLAIIANGPQHFAPQPFHRVEVGNLARPQLVREREFGPRLEPARKMIALGVIGNAFGWQRRQPFFELAQVARTRDFAAVGHPEDEIAEPEVFHHEAAKLQQQRRRVLDEKRGPDRSGQQLIFDPARLEHDRHVGLARANFLCKNEPGVTGDTAVAREFDV